MAAGSEVPQPANDPGRELFAFLGQIQDRLGRIEVQLRRIEEEILAAENRSFRQVGSFAGLTNAQPRRSGDALRPLARLP